MDNTPRLVADPPRGTFQSLAWLLIASFFVVLCLALLDIDAANSSTVGLPVVFIGALWSVPLFYALAKGDRRAFIIFLALFVFLTESNFRTRAWTDKSLDWQVMLKGLLWFGAGMVGLFHLRHVIPALSRPPAFWGLAFVAIITLSAAWSPTKIYTLQAGMAHFWFLMFGIAVALKMSEKDIHLALLIGTALIVIPSLAIAPFGTSLAGISPDSTAELDRLRGMTEHPIPLAENASLFLFLAMLWAARYRGGRWLLIILLIPAGAAVVVLTQSRLPPLAMIAAASLAIAHHRGGLSLLLPVFVGVMLLFAVDATVGLMNVIPGDILSAFSRSGRTGEVTSLSGRTDIWPFVIDKIKEAPFLGHGYASGTEVLKDFYSWKITHTHNMLLQSLLYLGIVGTMVLLLALWGQIKVFFVQPNIFRDTLIFFQIVKGFTEQSILSNMPGTGVLCWFITLGLSTMAIVNARRAALAARRPPGSLASAARM